MVTTIDQASSTLAGRVDALEAASGPYDAQGGWDASSGSFPSGSTAQDLWEVETAGTVDSVAFAVGDQLIALVDTASTSTYAANWYKKAGGVVTQADLDDLQDDIDGLGGDLRGYSADVAATDIAIGDTTSDSSTSGSVYANSEITAYPMILENVQVRVATGGSGLVYVLDRNNVITHKESFTLTSGVNTLTMPTNTYVTAGSRVFYEGVGASGVRYATGSGTNSISFTAGGSHAVGDTITLGASSSIVVAIKINGKKSRGTGGDRLSLLERAVGISDGDAVAAADLVEDEGGALYLLNGDSALYEERTSPATTPAAGDPVGTVEDASAGGYDLAAETDGGRPTLSTTGIGDSVALSFDGTQALTSSSGVSSAIGEVPTNAFAITAAFRGERDESVNTVWALSDGTDSIYLAEYQGALRLVYKSVTQTFGGSGGAAQVVTVLFQQGYATIWADGDQYGPYYMGLSTLTPDRFAIGARKAGSLANYFTGDIGSVVVTAGNPTQAKVLAVHRKVQAEVKARPLGISLLADKAARSIGNPAIVSALTYGTAPVAFICAGQSNMIGRAVFDSGDTHPSEALQVGSDGLIKAAADPLEHVNPDAGDMGLDNEFANDLIAAYPNAQIIFIPCAEGGTSFSRDDWNVGDALYEQMIARVNSFFRLYPEAVLGGILWHQGESDGADAAQAAYEAAFDAMIADARARIIAATPTTPLVVGNLLPAYVSSNADVEAVNDIITDTPNRIGNCALAVATSLTDVGDTLHFDAASLRTLGARYFTAWQTAVKVTLTAQ